MAGQPRRRAMIAELDHRARDWAEAGEDDPTPSLVDYAVAWIEDGGTLAGLADEISAERMIEVTRSMLSRYLNDAEGEEGSARLARARARGAHGLVESGLLALDKARDDDESKLADRANRARQWLAERWNRDELGKAPEVAIAISAHHLHLDALKRAPERDAAALLPASPDSVAPSDRVTDDAEGVEVVHEVT